MPKKEPIDRVFDALETGARVGVELMIRGARGTRRTLRRTADLLDEVERYASSRLVDDESPGADVVQIREEATPHSPAKAEGDVHRDTAFNFLDRP